MAGDCAPHPAKASECLDHRGESMERATHGPDVIRRGAVETIAAAPSTAPQNVIPPEGG
jgi:hypothetical protein